MLTIILILGVLRYLYDKTIGIWEFFFIDILNDIAEIIVNFFED